MARGRSRGHKGGRKQFSSADQIKDDLAKQEEKRRWREAHPDSESEESEEEEKPARPRPGDKKKGGRRQVVEEDSSSGAEEESSSEEEEDEDAKKKGVQGMIEIENPNRVKQKFKKASELDLPTGATGGAEGGAKPKKEEVKPQLSRREKEEIDKAKAKAHYQKMHAAGKTDEARADLARLSIIKKQREEAAEKRAAEAKAKEEAATAKAAAKGGKK